MVVHQQDAPLSGGYRHDGVAAHVALITTVFVGPEDLAASRVEAGERRVADSENLLFARDGRDDRRLVPHGVRADCPQQLAGLRVEAAERLALPGADAHDENAVND